MTETTILENAYLNNVSVYFAACKLGIKTLEAYAMEKLEQSVQIGTDRMQHLHCTNDLLQAKRAILASKSGDSEAFEKAMLRIFERGERSSGDRTTVAAPTPKADRREPDKIIAAGREAKEKRAQETKQPATPLPLWERKAKDEAGVDREELENWKSKAASWMSKATSLQHRMDRTKKELSDEKQDALVSKEELSRVEQVNRNLKSEVSSLTKSRRTAWQTVNTLDDQVESLTKSLDAQERKVRDLQRLVNSRSAGSSLKGIINKAVSGSRKLNGCPHCRKPFQCEMAREGYNMMGLKCCDCAHTMWFQP